MRILQIVNPVVSIPPKMMGGTERIVYALIQELIKLGHEVTLLAEDNSQPSSEIDFHGIGTYWEQKQTIPKVWLHLAKYGHRYDVIHNHGRLIFNLPQMWSNIAKVHTFHFGELQISQVKKFLSIRPRHFAFSPCGYWIADKYNYLGGEWNPIHNGLQDDLYSANYHVPEDAPLVSLGRMDPRKGTPQAIQVALATNRKLVIAGQVGDQPHEKQWFEENVLSYCDGKQIKFIGPVNDQQKQVLLSNASALLLPIQGSEAFTVVMIEALACGCPIIGYNQYCIPELVREGYNGFLAKDGQEMQEKVNRLKEIDRRNCRKDFEERFTSSVMANHYVSLYQQLGA